jgi:hypothetical protein
LVYQYYQNMTNIVLQYKLRFLEYVLDYLHI